MQEKLEISQWLHKRGFEPDMWTDNCEVFTNKKDVHLEESTLHGTSETERLYTHYYVPNFPYFTLNRVLELLPNVIREGGYKYEFNMYATCDGFVIQYASDCGAVQKDFERMKDE